MRVGGMLSEAVAPLVLLILLVHANALPVQYLPSIPGYIPVYIRHGDQPLEEIHLSLAAAFHEKTAIKKDIQKTPISLAIIEDSNKDLTDENLSSKSEEKEDSSERNFIPPAPSQQLIYALPRSEQTYSQFKLPEKESVIMKLHKPVHSDKIDLKNVTKEIQEQNQ